MSLSATLNLGLGQNDSHTLTRAQRTVLGFVINKNGLGLDAPWRRAYKRDDVEDGPMIGSSEPFGFRVAATKDPDAEGETHEMTQFVLESCLCQISPKVGSDRITCNLEHQMLSEELWKKIQSGENGF
jgi:hypothetical protein